MVGDLLGPRVGKLLPGVDAGFPDDCNLVGTINDGCEDA
jgi:hypothetical protein